MATMLYNIHKSPAARSSIQKFGNDYDVIFMTDKCYIAW